MLHIAGIPLRREKSAILDVQPPRSTDSPVMADTTDADG
jgi:hypothetical protein